ncbi:MAG: hypothetical protein ACRCVJ_05370 [Clostridium sp.]
MCNLAKVRTLLETIRVIGPHLNEVEIASIGMILNAAIERMTKESEEN